MPFRYLLMSIAFVSGTVQAQSFEKTTNLAEHSLNKCSESKLEKYIFDLGDVALYRQDCNADKNALTDSPVYVEFAYTRSLAGEDFAETASKLIARNISERAFQKIEADLNSFNKAYKSIEDGDRYAIAYSEQSGLVLSLNGEVLTSSDSQQLAQHYFTIWFGDKPFSNQLKDNLLGN